MKSGWHRGSKAKLYSSLTEEGFFCPGRFSFTLLRQKRRGSFLFDAERGSGYEDTACTGRSKNHCGGGRLQGAAGQRRDLIVSSLGVTGTRSEIKTDLAAIVKVVRENTKTPCAIGFGISTPEQAAKMAGIADGAIVGSAIIKLLEQYGTAAPEQIGAYVKRMKDAVRG